MGEVYLAHPPFSDDYHYQEQKAQSLIRNKPVNNLILCVGQWGRKLVSSIPQLTRHPFSAKALAWECLKATYRPTTAKRKDAIALLNGDDAEARLKYLEDRLRLIQTIGSAQDQIRFALDPLAEYLAALQLIENYGKNQGQWRKFLSQAATLPGAPAAIQGFLLAVHDCCLCQGAEVKVPDFVAQELKKQMGLASPPGQTQMAQRP